MLERDSDDDAAALSTCFLQVVERELIRFGHLEPEGLVESQLACTARSSEWWRRQRPKVNGRDVRSRQPLLDLSPETKRIALPRR